MFPKSSLLLYFIVLKTSCGNVITVENDFAEEKANILADIISTKPNHKGWTNFITMGRPLDSLYRKAHSMQYNFITANENFIEYEIDDIIRYRANVILLEASNFLEFEKNFNIVRKIPYFHPLSRIIVHYRNKESKDIIAKILYILWYYRCANAVIVQFDNSDNKAFITHYNPYISEKYMLDYSFGCWTTRKIMYNIESFEKSFTCTNGCHNITVNSYLRANHLGTCMGLRTNTVYYNNSDIVKQIPVFEDKGKNLHGFPLRTYVKEVIPFLLIDKNEDGSYKLHERDGFIWMTMSEIMNFTMDFSPSEKVMKEPFDYEVIIQQIFAFANRKGDILINTVYQFELVIIEVDMTVPYKASGVCFMSHRAGIETTLFDLNLLQSNYKIFIMFICCFFAIWFVFCLFNYLEKNTLTFDQAGKDLVNAIRNILSISLFKPPKNESFRIFLLISIWSFFILNFATQAAIISFFSTYKRGKEVETYDDIIEKGYIIEGMASPDVVLPDTEEKYRKINAKLVPIPDLFGCVEKMNNDSHRFCLIDCSVGRYLELNKLNDKGEQYLHIAKDKVHNYYLNMILQKDSALTDQFNKNMLTFVEAGLISKWEQYRFTEIKSETPIKALGIDDLIGILKCYLLLVGLSVTIFLLEITICAAEQGGRWLKKFLLRWKRTYAAKRLIKRERKLGKIDKTNSSTQTT